MSQLYFDLLPYDLITALAYYFPWKTIKMLCNNLISWQSLCTDVRFLRKYISETHDVPLRALVDSTLPFLIEYLDAPSWVEKFAIVKDYDYLPLFIYYVEETIYGQQLKTTSGLTRPTRWILKLAYELNRIKAYKIIRYLVNTYNDKLNKENKYELLINTLYYDDITLFKYFIEDLHYDRDLDPNLLKNIYLHGLNLESNEIREYIKTHLLK